MTISFDLDDTLIPGSKTFETEDQNWIQRILGVEKIRKGTIGLFKELRYRGHRIQIYTTSFRPTLKVKLTFLSYGIPVDRVINQESHDKELKGHRTKYSKYPPAFGIDLHVDDLPGVKIEAERFNFRAIIVDEKDSSWVDRILGSV